VSDRPDLRVLLGDDVPAPELERLGRIDELLRATPAPPEVLDRLTASVLAIPGRHPRFQRRRLAATLALAAALAATTFGIGLWAGGGSDEVAVVEQLTLSGTAEAPQARMVITVLPEDAAGNWPMAADVSGLAPLPSGGYYEVWLTKGAELAASCGRFVVDENGEAKGVWLNAPYRLEGFDRWVVTAHAPGEEESKAPWLLDGPVAVPA
jgi:hypothetical protein